MSMKFKIVIIIVGVVKLVVVIVFGGKKVILFVMVVGDGNGKLLVLDVGQMKLVYEVWCYVLNKVSVDNKNKNYIVVELVVLLEVGGFWMCEFGLYDDVGILIVVVNMVESYKFELVEGFGCVQICCMVIIVSNVVFVELSIDVSMVMVMQDYVDKVIFSFYCIVIDDVVFQYKVVYDIDYVGIFDGVDNMSQGFCICDMLQGIRMFLYQFVLGGVRIVEMIFNFDGENENLMVILFFFVFVDIGYQSIGVVCEDGCVMLYILIVDGKGVNIINWNGVDISLIDVICMEIFIFDFFIGDEIIMVVLLVDGSLLIVQLSNEVVYFYYNRDDCCIVYVFDCVFLMFKYWIYLFIQLMVLQVFQGMVSDGYYLFVYYGYIGVFLIYCIVVYNLLMGEVVRQFNVDGVCVRYGCQKMLGNVELGYFVLQEVEGLVFYNGKLYLFDMDFWCQIVDVVFFEGVYFVVCVINFFGCFLVNLFYWMFIVYGMVVVMKYDVMKFYMCGVVIKCSKVVVFVEVYDGIGYLVDFGVVFFDSYVSFFLSFNVVNIVLLFNEDFQVVVYEQNLCLYCLLFEVRKEVLDIDIFVVVFCLYGDVF